MTCVPPPEAREVRWHWVQFRYFTPQIAEWQPFDGRGWWGCINGGCSGNSQWMADLGYRYVAPITMPETENHQ